MAINNTFDQLDGIDQGEREAAEARALEAGSRIVDEREAAAQERFEKASQLDSEDARFAGKYKSAEELEKAYLELQRKLGEQSASDDVAEEPQEGEEEASEEGDDEEVDEEISEALQALVSASQEFDTDEGISESTLDKLAQLDSRTLVQEWAKYVSSQREQAAQAQISNEQVASIRQIAGGDDGYQEMIGWAAENLSPDEIAAYDSVMNGTDYGAMYWAAQGLRSRFVAEVGQEGKTYSGKRQASTEPGFRSQAELARAISDPRYKNDPAYRIDVQDKLARSGNLL